MLTGCAVIQNVTDSIYKFIVEPQKGLPKEVSFPCSAPPSLFFINGILNSREEALESALLLSDKLGRDVELIYNNSETVTRSIIALINITILSSEELHQRLLPQISKNAPYSDEDMKEMAKVPKAISNGSRPIIVAHSYGNVLAAKVCRENKIKPKNINVASPSKEKDECSVGVAGFAEDAVVKIFETTGNLKWEGSIGNEVVDSIKSHFFSSYLESPSASKIILGAAKKEAKKADATVVPTLVEGEGGFELSRPACLYESFNKCTFKIELSCKKPIAFSAPGVQIIETRVMVKHGKDKEILMRKENYVGTYATKIENGADGAEVLKIKSIGYAEAALLYFNGLFE